MVRAFVIFIPISITLGDFIAPTSRFFDNQVADALTKALPSAK